jgi:hypothetical protein
MGERKGRATVQIQTSHVNLSDATGGHVALHIGWAVSHSHISLAPLSHARSLSVTETYITTCRQPDTRLPHESRQCT